MPALNSTRRVFVLTDDTRLARPELLEEVEGEIVGGRLVTKVETGIARAIGNLWRCVLQDDSYKACPGAKAIGSGTRMTASRVFSQSMLVRANRVPTRKTTTWNDHHRKPCSWCIRAKRLRQQKSRHLALAVYPRLFSHHFDIQSTARKSHCHGYSCRLPAPVFSPL